MRAFLPLCTHLEELHIHQDHSHVIQASMSAEMWEEVEAALGWVHKRCFRAPQGASCRG